VARCLNGFISCEERRLLDAGRNLPSIRAVAPVLRPADRPASPGGETWPKRARSGDEAVVEAARRDGARPAVAAGRQRAELPSGAFLAQYLAQLGPGASLRAEHRAADLAYRFAADLAVVFVPRGRPLDVAV
jgi:hypothetical protein